MHNVPLYVRFRGQVRGPFRPDQIQEMIRSRQITDLHEVSADSVTWVSLGQQRAVQREALSLQAQLESQREESARAERTPRPAPAASLTPTADPAPPPEAPRRTSRGVPIAITAACFVILLIGAAAIWYSRPSAPASRLIAGGTRSESTSNTRIDTHVGLVVTSMVVKLADDRVETWELNSGSAFAVSEDGMMLTNRHVACPDKVPTNEMRFERFTQYEFKDGTSFTPTAFVVQVRFNGDEWFPADIVEVGDGENQDIAVLQLKNKTFTDPFKVAANGDRQESVLACGFPGILMGVSKELSNTGGQSEALQRLFQRKTEGEVDPRISYPAKTVVISITPGQISAILPTTVGRAYVTNAYISGGNSGGPLLNQRGEVVGIVTASTRGTDNVNIAYSVHDLLTVLAFRNPKLSILVSP